MNLKKNLLNSSTFIKISIFIVSFLFTNLLFSQGKVSSNKALNMLRDGNQRFVKGALVHPNLTQEVRFATAENGQHPYATIIGCSDSRVPIEAIFDAGIGELFIVRVAGNVVDTNEAGSIEYGVGHLRTPLLVVLGHTHCGAVTAATRGDEVHGSIPALVNNIIPAVEKAKHDYGSTFTPELIELAIKYNVWQSIEDLLKRSSETVELVKEGKLQVVGAIYNISTGEVEWLGEHPMQTTLLEHPQSSHKHY